MSKKKNEFLKKNRHLTVILIIIKGSRQKLLRNYNLPQYLDQTSTLSFDDYR